MLIAVLVILTIVFFGATYLLYWKKEIIQWLDNRYGPQSREEKQRPHRRRMYE